MLCRSKKCQKKYDDSFVFCPWCGASKEPEQRAKHRRENLTGTVYKRADLKNKPWVAATSKTRNKSSQIIGYYETARAARDALEAYRIAPTDKLNITVKQLYDEWKPIGYKDKSKQLCDCYNAAWKNLNPIHDIKFRELRTAQMQRVIESLQEERPKLDKDGNRVIKKDKPVLLQPLGYSSLSKIKILLGLLYQYALENDIVNKNYAEFLVLPKKGDSAKDRFTDIEKKQIEKSAGTVPFADCILIMCYTGFRIGEFLSLTKFSMRYHGDQAVLIGGEKTEAGKDRLVPVHPKIKEYVEKWVDKDGETIFCRDDGKPYSVNYFRKNCYYPALEKMGIRALSPHATRRTFSTGMAAAGARPEDIIALMGHTDYAVDIESYINQETETLAKAIEKLS